MINVTNSHCSDDKDSQSQQQEHNILGERYSQFPNVKSQTTYHAGNDPERNGWEEPRDHVYKISNCDYNEFQLKSNKWNEKLSLQNQKNSTRMSVRLWTKEPNETDGSIRSGLVRMYCCFRWQRSSCSLTWQLDYLCWCPNPEAVQDDLVAWYLRVCLGGIASDGLVH